MTLCRAPITETLGVFVVSAALILPSAFTCPGGLVGDERGFVGFVLSRISTDRGWGHPRMVVLPALAVAWIMAGIDLAYLGSVV